MRERLTHRQHVSPLPLLSQPVSNLYQGTRNNGFHSRLRYSSVSDLTCPLLPLMICTFRAFASGRLWPILGLPRCPFLRLPTIVRPRSAACGTDRKCLQESGHSVAALIAVPFMYSCINTLRQDLSNMTMSVDSEITVSFVM